MKKIEKLDKYFITPNTKFYGGFVYDGEDIFLCDDKIEEEDFKCRVVQSIENNVLKTKLTKEYKMKNGNTVKEKSNMEIGINKDQLLVYVEGQGFVISEYKMRTLKEAIGLYKIME